VATLRKRRVCAIAHHRRPLWNATGTGWNASGLWQSEPEVCTASY